MSNKHHVVVIVYPDVSLFTLAGFLETCEQALLEREMNGKDFNYRVTVASVDGGAIAGYFGCTVNAVPLASLEGQRIDTLMICGGLGFRAAMQDGRLIGWLKDNGPRVGRICTAGTGSFILARTGMLDGKRVVTHWLMNDEFAANFPSVLLVRDTLYLNDGKIWSSAGMGSAIDFCLALIEESEGRDFAYTVAQRVLVFLRRSGDQPQISSMLRAQAREGDRFDRLHEWVYANLRSDLRVEVLAAQVGMSPRNFGRVYFEKMKTTPANAIMRIKVEVAHDMLLKTDARIQTIAFNCGFGDEQRMRRAFLRCFGISPSEMRANASAGRPALSGAALKASRAGEGEGADPDGA